MATEKDFRDLRTDYNWGSLDELNVKQDPFEQFADWYEAYFKTGAIDSTAVTVSTVDKEGQPDSRIVLLKEIRDKNFIFYTNHSSKKGRDLANNPKVHLMFFWPQMERQIRIKGVASFMAQKESEIYFKKRPFKSQIAAAVSPQSAVVPNREYLEQLFFEVFKEENSDGYVKMPKDWGGVKVTPIEFEFWQGRTSRLHDRLRFKQDKDLWKIERLAP